MKKLSAVVENIMNKMLFAAFIVMFVAVMLQIITRFIPSISLPWTEELTRLSFVYTIALGAPLAIKYDEYAQVDILMEMFPFRGKLFLKLVVSVLVTLFALIGAYTSLGMIPLGSRQTSVYLRIPMYFSYLIIPLSFALVFIASVFKTAERALDFANPVRVETREREAEEEKRKANEEEARLIKETGIFSEKELEL